MAHVYRYEEEGARDYLRSKGLVGTAQLGKQYANEGRKLIEDAYALFEAYGGVEVEWRADRRLEGRMYERIWLFNIEESANKLLLALHPYEGIKAWTMTEGKDDPVAIQFEAPMQYDRVTDTLLGPIVYKDEAVDPERDHTKPGAPHLRISPLEALVQWIWKRLNQ